MDTDCQKCCLAGTRNKIVLFGGNKNARVMLIGEAPGADEDAVGLPFVGRAGKFLTKLLEEAGFDREKDLYITNIVKCRPPNNRKPLPDEIAACAPVLEKQIEEVKPEIIILVGSVALSYFIKDKKLTISKARGNIFEWRGIKLAPVFHPSYLLRNHSETPDSPRGLTRSDFKAIKKLLEN